MGLHLFRLHIVLNNLVQTRTVEGLLMLIEKERQGDTVDRTLLKSLLRMLSDLQIYQEAFETKYVINPVRIPFFIDKLIRNVHIIIDSFIYMLIVINHYNLLSKNLNLFYSCTSFIFKCPPQSLDIANMQFQLVFLFYLGSWWLQKDCTLLRAND